MKIDFLGDLRESEKMSRIGICKECGKELKIEDNAHTLKDYQNEGWPGLPQTFKLCDTCYDYLLKEQYIEE